MSQKNNGHLRKAVLWGSLVLTVMASVYTYVDTNKPEDATLAEPLVREVNAAPSTTDSNQQARSSVYPVDAAASSPSVLKTKVLGDPFAPLAVALPVAPAPVAPAVATAPPSAPPLPFLYAGKFEQAVPKSATNAKGAGTQTVIYLTRGNDSFAVTPGDAIDANYQFIGLEGETLVFMYLPLSTRQTLPIGP